MIFEDKIIAQYKISESIKSTAKKLQIGEQTVRRVLILAGAYATDKSEKVAELLRSGLSADAIAKEMGISRSAVQQYLPYTKGSYHNPPSKNALRIRRCREK